MHYGIKLPFVRFRNREEFDNYCTTEKESLDARYVFECSLSTKDSVVVREGSCAVCLKLTKFKSATVNGTILPDGENLPNWRETQNCGCNYALSSRERATIHYLTSWVGVEKWKRLLLLGPSDFLETALGSRCELTTVSNVTLHQKSEPSGIFDAVKPMRPYDPFHIVVAPDILQCAPDWRGVVAAIHQIMITGGSFVFTVPFSVYESVTISAEQQTSIYPSNIPDLHTFGWDVLTSLVQAGFDDANANLYWSAELGYLGTYNLIFSATA